MRKNFEKLIATSTSLANQEKEIIEKFENWRGKELQTDDIMVVGIEF